MNGFVDVLLLISSIAAGVWTVLVFKLGDRQQLKILNAFTGAFLLSLTFLHLLPEVYGAGHAHGGAEAGQATSSTAIGLLILAGFFVQIALDSVSMGVEHGHSHHIEGRLAIGVVIGLCLHAFIEAMALGNSAGHHDPASRRLLLWSIVIHNYPVSIALLGMLLQSGVRRGRALGIMVLFAAMAPLGMSLSAHTDLAHHTRELTAIVIGIFMHISTTILFESSESHRFNRAKSLAIAVGTALGAGAVFFH